MRLYSSRITRADVETAFLAARVENGADIWLDGIREFRPRRGGNGAEFWAYSQNGTRATGHRAIGSYDLSGERRAASWTDYGYVIAHLFNMDSHARIGPYNGEADFVAKVRRLAQAHSLTFLDTLANLPHYPR